MPPESKRFRRLSSMTFAKMMRLLLQPEGVTAQEIEVETGLGLRTIKSALLYLNKEGVIYRCGWAEDAIGRRNTLETFTLGDKPNVKRPPPSLRTERRSRMKEAKRMLNLMAGEGDKRKRTNLKPTHSDAPETAEV